jgi:hypothetical protein
MLGMALKPRRFVKAVLHNEASRYGILMVAPHPALMGAKGEIPHLNLLAARLARHGFLVKIHWPVGMFRVWVYGWPSSRNVSRPGSDGVTVRNPCSSST